MLTISTRGDNNQLYSCQRYNVKQQTVSKDLISGSSSTISYVSFIKSSNFTGLQFSVKMEMILTIVTLINF